MENLEIHFFHGFLGQPEDWDSTIASLTLPRVETQTHSLVDLYHGLNQDRSLLAAAQKIQSDFLTSANKKMLVGYSLGGRLLMHLNPESFDAMLLLGSHPGLIDNREQRQRSDSQWVEKAEHLSQSDWLEEWNQQDVFSSDRNRPHRQFTDSVFQAYIQILQAWSVARQQDFRETLQRHGHKIFWACGEEDKKYRALANELEDLLPNEHVFVIPDSGHGILFDQPQEVARAVEKVATYDR